MSEVLNRDVLGLKHHGCSGFYIKTDIKGAFWWGQYEQVRCNICGEFSPRHIRGFLFNG